MSDVFISYSRADKVFVRRLHAGLTKLNRDVWVDWEDIPATADWWQEICTGIDNANTFLFIITPESVRSSICRQEIDYALTQKKRFIPVLYREITTREDQAAMHPVISSHNWVMFRENDVFDDSLKALLSAIDTDLAHVKMHTQLLVRAREWDTKGRANTYLLGGGMLQEAEAWLVAASGKSPEPTELHTQFILASRRQAARRGRTLLAISVAVALISIALAIFAAFQTGIANTALGEANTQEVNARNNYQTALAAQGTAEFNATLAFQEQVRAEENASTATNALGAAQDRGTQIAAAATEVAKAQSTAIFNAQSAANNAATATNALGQSQDRGTRVAIQVTQVAVAQNTALAEADNRATQEAIAIANANEAATAQFNAEFNATLAIQQQQRAENLLVTSEYQGQILAVQITEVADANSTANALFISAVNSAATARFNARAANQNAATATSALGEVQARGTQVQEEAWRRATQEALANEARATAEFNATLAYVEQDRAKNSEATATWALGESELRGTQVAEGANSLATREREAVEARATAEFNATLAYVEQERAKNSEATATWALGESEIRGTQVAEGANSLATREREAVEARATAEFNATLAVQEQERAELNAATAVSAEGTAVYNAEQALGQALAVNAELAIGTGDYDLALALALESIGIRPDLAQAQRVLNQIVYSAARMSYDAPKVAELSPDGRHVLVSNGNELVLWNIDTRAVAQQFVGHSAVVNAAEFSEDGRWIASGGADNLVILWDVATGQEIRRYAGHDGPVNDVDITSDKRLILSVSDDTTAISWDTSTDTMIRRHVNISSRPIYRVRIAPNDQDFWTWSGEGEAFMGLWRLSDSARRYDVPDPLFRQISERTNYALTDSRSGPIKVYNAYSLQVVREFVRGFDWTIQAPGARAFNPSGNQVAIALTNEEGLNPRLFLVDVASGEIVRRLNFPGRGHIGAVAYSPDGTLLLTGYDNQIIIWNVETGREVRRLNSHNETVTQVSINEDGTYVISRSRDGNVRIWDLNLSDIAQISTITAQTQIPEVRYPGFSSDGVFIVAGVFNSVFQWNSYDSEQSGRVDPGGTLLNIVYDHVNDVALLVTTNYTRLLRMTDLTSMRDLSGRDGDRFTGEAAFSIDGSLVIYGTNDNFIVRENPGGERTPNWLISKQDIPDGFVVTDMVVTPDNNELIVVTGQPDVREAAPGPILIYDLGSATLARTVTPSHIRTVNTIALSPDGRTALTGGEDGDLYLFNVETGQTLRRFVGHNGAVNEVAFMRDGRSALSVSDDTLMIQWDLATGQPLRRFQGHLAPIVGLALSPDGRRAVTATGGDTMIIWDIGGEQNLIAFTCAVRYIPQLSCVERTQFGVNPPCAVGGLPPQNNICAVLGEQ